MQEKNPTARFPLTSTAFPSGRRRLDAVPILVNIGKASPLLSINTFSYAVPFIDYSLCYLVRYLTVENVPDVIVSEAADGNDAAPYVGTVYNSPHVLDGCSQFHDQM